MSDYAERLARDLTTAYEGHDHDAFKRALERMKQALRYTGPVRQGLLSEADIRAITLAPPGDVDRWQRSALEFGQAPEPLCETKGHPVPFCGPRGMIPCDCNRGPDDVCPHWKP